MVDLDAIRASRAACADIPWSCPCVSGEQLDALIEELERLRDADAKTQAWWADQVRLQRDEERDAAAQFLRGFTNIEDAAMIASWIEHNEHRREEER